jgi:hypothetical protein
MKAEISVIFTGTFLAFNREKPIRNGTGCGNDALIARYFSLSMRSGLFYGS